MSDRAYIRLAVAKAKRRNPALSGLVFDFVRDLLLKASSEGSSADQKDRIAFLMKFQQTTSPVTAKGVEDTALYLYNRLLSLNEVGGDPERFGIEPHTFHEAMQDRLTRWPYSLSATATHDTKRGEDVRARLNVLSEIPPKWRSHVSRWHRLNRKRKLLVDDQPAPDPNVEYFLYQTLIGSWPPGPMTDQEFGQYHDRIQAYMTKALREAKVHTSWINPNHPYEDAVKQFVRALLDRTKPNAFLNDLRAFVAAVTQLGMYNSLSQLVLKTAAPGVPDFYQGSELWDLTFVDPDNRRPVDFETRDRLLSVLLQASASTDRHALIEDLLRNKADGRIKLFVTATALRYRRDHARVFLAGTYRPLNGFGVRERHLCAFARIHESETLVAVVPRLIAGLLPTPDALPIGEGIWGDTRLELPAIAPGSTYRNLFTGETVRPAPVDGRPMCAISKIFATFPVALLELVP